MEMEISGHVLVEDVKPHINSDGHMKVGSKRQTFTRLDDVTQQVI